jgi:hypothetical protein
MQSAENGERGAGSKRHRNTAITEAGELPSQGCSQVGGERPSWSKPEPATPCEEQSGERKTPQFRIRHSSFVIRHSSFGVP